MGVGTWSSARNPVSSLGLLNDVVDIALPVPSHHSDTALGSAGPVRTGTTARSVQLSHSAQVCRVVASPSPVTSCPLPRR